MPRHDVSIIIPCFNKVDYTLRCLESLVAHTPEDRYEVVLVDNASSDETPELCARLDGDVVVVRNETNLGFSKACNQGAAAAGGRHLLFLNNDTEALPGWLEPLLAVLDHEQEVGAVGSKLLFPDGTLQHAGVFTYEVEGGLALSASHLHYRGDRDLPVANRRRDLEVVTGACVAIRREAFEQAGGFDEGYWNGNEDVDLCISLRQAGWRVVYEPASELFHHESVSGPERFRKVDDNVRRLGERWGNRYAPEGLVVDSLLRLHPRRARTEIHIAGGSNRRPDLDRTVRAARGLIREGETICIDAALSPDPSWAGGQIRIGLPDPQVPFRLELHAGVVLDRPSFDRLMATALHDDVAEAGPVLAGARGPQGIERWLGPAAPRGATARRRLLGEQVSVVAKIDELDPACRLRRAAAGASTRVVVGAAYADVSDAGALAGAAS